MRQSYKRSPVIEAVVDFQLAKQLPLNVVDRVRSKLKAQFPQEGQNKNYNLKLDVENGKGTADTQATGYRLSTHDNLNIRIINVGNFTISRLAPYLGWEKFREDARRDWDVWFDIVGKCAFTHLGLRYVNRIDIPHYDNVIDLEKYFSIGINFPQPPLSPMSDFAMHVKSSDGDSADPCTVMVRFSQIEAAMIGHNSIVLDIDVYKNNLTGSSDEMWSVVDGFHDVASKVFEASIKSPTREILGHA